MHENLGKAPPPFPPEFEIFEPAPSQVGLGEALDWLSARCAASALSETGTFALTLSLDEMLSNSLMHGYAGIAQDDPAGFAPRVRIGYRRMPQGAELRIQDNGCEFDPTRYETREQDVSLEDAEIGGHGIRLMRALLVSMHYRRQDGWNESVLTASDDESHRSGE